jgi:predicted small metal-binding protein
MKSMTCKQLGGACDLVLEAETFDELVEKSKQHGMEMFQKQDPQHLQAMQKIMLMMQNPEEMQAWFDAKRKEFEQL